MKLIVDTNKIIACLLRDGRVRNVFFNPRLTLYTHKYAIEEIEKHKGYLVKKTSEKAFKLIFGKAASKIGLVEFSKDDVNILKEAKEISKDFDLDDYPFIALALKFSIPIWTNDGDMIRHGLISKKYTALDTHSLEELLEGRSLENVKENLKKKYLKNNSSG